MAEVGYPESLLVYGSPFTQFWWYCPKTDHNSPSSQPSIHILIRLLLRYHITNKFYWLVHQKGSERVKTQSQYSLGRTEKNEKLHPGQTILWSKFQLIHEYNSEKEHHSEIYVMPGPTVFVTKAASLNANQAYSSHVHSYHY
jgi:hypothetical protein